MPTIASSSPQGIAPTQSKTALERQFLIALKTVLDRAYQDGVDQFYNWKVDGDTITGVFRDGTQGYKFSLSGKGLVYHPVGKTRSDSDIEGATLANSAMRLDAGAKRRKCKGTTTYACGGACLPNKKVCRINSKHIVTAQEMKTLSAMGSQLKKPLAEAEVFEVFEKPIVDLSPQKKEKKPINEMTIRELRAEAQERGVPGYSHVDKDTLKAMVVAWDKEPEAQKRIVKVIEKRTQERQSDPFTEFKRFFGLKKVLGAGSAITAAIILKVGLHSYNKVKDRYQGNFSTSAETAKNQTGINVASVPDSKEYITFAVDRMGDHNTGTLEKELLNADPKFFKKHHIVTVGSDAFEAGEKIKPNPVVPEPLREGFEAYQAVTKRLSSAVVAGRDPQAIELAAQVLAYHKQYPDKQINLMGDHDGGMVVNEAAEILLRAKKDLAQNLRIVNLATPHFGLTDPATSLKGDNTGRTVTVSAGADPNNFFPKQNNAQINTVKDGSVKAYIGDENSMEVIRRAMGYYEDTNSSAVKIPGYKQEPWRPDDPRNHQDFRKKPKDTQDYEIGQYMFKRKKEEDSKTVAGQGKKRSFRLGKKAGGNFRRSIQRNTAKAASSTTQPPTNPPNTPPNPPPAAASGKPKPKPNSGGGGSAASGASQGSAKKTGASGKKAAGKSQSSTSGASAPPANPPASPTTKATPAPDSRLFDENGQTRSRQTLFPKTISKPAANKSSAPGESIQEPILPKEEPKPTGAKKHSNPRSTRPQGDYGKPPKDDTASGSKKKKDSADQSAAYREAFSLTARRFGGA